MKTRFIILILMITSLSWAASFFSLLHYFDPYTHVLWALTLLLLSYILMSVSFLRCYYIL